MTPTVRLASLVAAIGATGLAIPFGVVCALWIALAIAAVVDGRLVSTPPTITRSFPALARGIASPMRIEVDDSASVRRARRITIRQPQPPDITVSPAVGDGRVLATEITARRRGVHALPGVGVRLEGPLGLAAAVHVVAAPGSVAVHPDLPTAHRLALAARRGLLQSDGRSRGPLGLGTEFESVRDYRPDDDVRQINWLATARTGRAMSTVYRQEDDRDLIIVVETGRLTAGSFAGPDAESRVPELLSQASFLQREPLDLHTMTRLDALFDAVAALALVADEVGDRVGLLTYDFDEHTRLMPQRRGGRDVIQAALNLEPQPVESDHDIAVRRLPATRRSIVALATELLDDANSGSLVGAVARLQSAHDVIVIAARDPFVEAAAIGDDPSLQAAARQLLADRQNLVGRLNATGAVVISAAPHDLAAASTRAYLSRRSGTRMKRTRSAS